MGLASFPVAELTNIGIANVDTAAKEIAENADVAIGAKVRMSENVIAKNGIEPLRRAIGAGEKAGTGGRVLIACWCPGAGMYSAWDADYQPSGRIADEVAARFFPDRLPLDLAEEGKGLETGTLGIPLRRQ